mgnify:FL=1|tara:strand:- start:572 stop:1459 length:888 start_codon:yes stop_codon:yes gene_type:complete
MSELSGMTGFARVAGEAAWGSWAWEAKSVNGRSLDVRVNTPPGFDALDRAVKAAASKLFNRGSLQVSLRIDMSTGDETVTVNEGLLTALTNAAQAIHGVGLSGEAIATLMTLKGVVETGGSSLRELAQDEAVIELLSDAANAALKDLAEARRTEGASLTGIMTGLVGEMEGFAAAATKLADSQPGLLKARLTKQLDELDAEGRVDADRAAVEIALSAAKADVREELDRLAAHFAGARDLLAGGSPVGRKLDFLAQELNREANTLCSKSVSLDLTNAGLGLKGVIDQFKEQAANVE